MLVLASVVGALRVRSGFLGKGRQVTSYPFFLSTVCLIVLADFLLLSVINIYCY